ncbi:MAG: addiction module protein [Chromatiales bacterium]|nr:addiction module protein [Gammaproteobacteria bacterium]
MKPAMQLNEMSVEEKIQTMEAIWDDLCHQSEPITSPDWHADVLREREAAVERGDETFEDWETAKKAIRKRIS